MINTVAPAAGGHFAAAYVSGGGNHATTLHLQWKVVGVDAEFGHDTLVVLAGQSVATGAAVGASVIFRTKATNSQGMMSAAARKRWKSDGLKFPDISTRPEAILLGFVQMAANSGSFDGAWATGRENFPTAQPTLPIDLRDAFEIGVSGDHGDQPDNYRVLRTYVGFREV